MSKGNMFLGHARGKVGSVVFYRANGQQVTRALAEVVKNPRSVGQNTQRAIFATIAKAAAALSPIVDHSFAGIAYGTESMRQFRRLNLDKLRREYLSSEDINVALTPKGGGLVPNNYQISSGNLPAFQVINDADGTNVHFRMGVTVNDDEDVIGWDQLKVIYPNILPGDQLTIVKIVSTGGTLAEGDGQFAVQYDRVILSPDESLLRSLDYVINTVGFNSAAVDQTVTTNLTALKSTTSGNGWYIGLGNGNQVEQGIYACALILSRRISDSTWQRSTQSMVVINDDDIQDTTVAIATYDGTSTSLAGSDEYLDQAIETEASPGISNEYLQVTIGSQVFNARPGETIDGGTFTLTEDLVINGVAYGTSENRVTDIAINGNNADGQYLERGSGRGNSKSVMLYPGDDGNFAGTYELYARFQSGGFATVNFTLAPGA